MSTISNTKRVAVTGITTALVGAGLAAATTGSAQASTNVWDRVAQCESGGNWGINTGNGFHGGLQFTPSTWRAYGGSGSAANASKAQQIAVAQRVLASQGPGAWPVCSRKAGLSRGNGGSAGTPEVSRSTTRTAVKVAKKATLQKAVAKKTTTSVKVAKPAKALASTKVTKATSRKATASAKNLAAVSRPTVVAAKKAAFVSYFTNPASAASIKAIQTKLGVPADGVVGPVTARAIQAYVGVTQDGIIGRKTIAAIEKKAGVQQTGERRIDTHIVKVLAAHLAK